MSVFELRDVKYVYQSQYQRVEAIGGISCAFDSGRVYAIMGTSGSGKTTLLSLMAGMDVPTEGSVLCEGTSTSDMDLERYRREKVAVIYQDFRLLPLLTVAENVMYPMELRGMRPAAARERAMALLARVDCRRRQRIAFPPCCPAANSNGCPSPAPWGWIPRSCWPTSRQAIWTATTVKKSFRS